MREDPDYHRRLLDGGDDRQVAAALLAVFEVDIEHAPEQVRRRAVRVFVLRRAGILRCARHYWALLRRAASR